MRTTIRLDDQLLMAAKQVALRQGKTLTALFEEALRELLARQERVRPRARVRLTTVKGQGLLPGVDLDDSAALADLMEGPHGPG